MTKNYSEHVGSNVIGRTAELRDLSLRGITKSFGDTKANSDVTFDIKAGSIHSVVGQNGAGKSTLVKIIFGIEQADSGEVLLGGKPLRVRSPREALESGIGLVAQELALIDELTALDNLILGHELTRGVFLDRARALSAAEHLQAQLGFELPWSTRVAELSVPQKQQIEVLRLLLQGADTLIFDEPTAALAPTQIDGFLELLRRLRSEGRTIVFISHKLREVFEISDFITVLRGGKHVATMNASECDSESISLQMLGEPMAPNAEFSNIAGEPILTTSGLKVRDNKDLLRVNDVDAQFKTHAITGICGVTGNGQEEFMEALAGVLLPEGGAIVFDGINVTSRSVRQRRTLGMAYVPPDRRNQGLAQLATIAENAFAGFQHDLSSTGWLSPKRVKEHVNNLLAKFQVVHGGTTLPISSLSGGNQQKLLIGREIMHQPKVLIACQPTRGIDIGGMRNIHELLQDERDSGVAVILQSEDLDELLLVSDEILVFFGGRVVRTFARPFDRTAIGEAMVGVVHA